MRRSVPKVSELLRGFQIIVSFGSLTCSLNELMSGRLFHVHYSLHAFSITLQPVLTTSIMLLHLSEILQARFSSGGGTAGLFSLSVECAGLNVRILCICSIRKQT